ncbi:MAG: nucleoside triphosphate pyrophosphohydrolase [Lentisphaerae bacterium]|nr:nucleoside triphosphate pyrophosphohydrolase [Lentisphaerota bacterium]
MSATSGIERLLDVIDRLRGEGGCPWDRKQTLRSLKPLLIEECYEVLDAVDYGDADAHAEELGDVLMHIALHSRIRKEEGAFTFDDVAHRIADKLIRRHPHVFADTRVADSGDVLRNWEAIKAREKGSRPRSVLEGVPRHLPALQRAQRIQSRAARVGFDWDTTEPVMDKIAEELDECREAVREGDAASVEHEIGDLFFALVNWCRFLNVDAEQALRRAADRFTRRFQGVEARVRAEGRRPADCTLAELDAHWNAVKAEEQAADRPAERRPD